MEPCQRRLFALHKQTRVVDDYWSPGVGRGGRKSTSGGLERGKSMRDRLPKQMQGDRKAGCRSITEEASAGWKPQLSRKSSEREVGADSEGRTICHDCKQDKVAAGDVNSQAERDFFVDRSGRS